jgi:basic amino acid/polyamine antiporter, APA family
MPRRRMETREAWRRSLEAAARVEPPTGLRRGLGNPALFGIVQGFVAASIYFSLGLVASRALGLTWLVFLAGAILFALVVVCYVEGASLHQERGGATVIARYAFNELWSFVAGWAICLDYLILVALCAFMTTDYAGVLWGPLAHGVPEFLMGFAVVVYVSLVAARGPRPRRYERVALLVLVDLVLQLLLVALGLALLFDPDVITAPASLGGHVSFDDLVTAFPLVLVAFSGIDASSGLAGQVAIGRKGLKRLVVVRFLAAVVPYVGLALVASSVLPRAGTNFEEAPVVAVVDAFEQDWLREPLRYVIAVAAVGTLVLAAQAAMLGLSRLGYGLAINRQIPSRIGYLHPRRSTPVVVIGIGAVLSVVLLVPADLEFLAAICAFGATLTFTLVGVAIVRLRFTEPGRDRPYRVRGNVRVRGADLPVPAVLCALGSAVAFVSLLVEHGSARWVGVGWMAFGLGLYVLYRTSQGKALTRRVTVPEQALSRGRAAEAEYGSMLVPVLGTPLDDDIMQTAGRLAADENEDDGEGGAVIEALWIFEVPMALPLDARVPESELKRARRALARSKAVGEEYEGVEVATAVIRARRAGEAIVHEARRRGVEAIVLAAEEPTRVGGGMRLGGKQGLHDTFVGETTRYVVNKAPCRVILTAPPAWRVEELGRRAAPDPTHAAEASPAVPTGHPLPIAADGGRAAVAPHSPHAAVDPDGLPSPEGAGPITDPAAGERPLNGRGRPRS